MFIFFHAELLSFFSVFAHAVHLSWNALPHLENVLILLGAAPISPPLGSLSDLPRATVCAYSISPLVCPLLFVNPFDTT